MLFQKFQRYSPKRWFDLMMMNPLGSNPPKKITNLLQKIPVIGFNYVSSFSEFLHQLSRSWEPTQGSRMGRRWSKVGILQEKTPTWFSPLLKNLPKNIGWTIFNHPVVMVMPWFIKAFVAFGAIWTKTWESKQKIDTHRLDGARTL